jgi:hypothetical protein
MLKQRGITLSGMIMGCIILGVVALIGMKLWPVYNEKFKVDVAMDKLASSPEGVRLGRVAMARILEKQFDVNGLDTIDPRKLPKMLKVDRIKGGGKQVTLAYEIRGQLFGDLDAALNYSKTIQFGVAKTD